MIFSGISPDGESHIDKIRKGTKTQTRRINRGLYKIGHSYSVQRGRGKKGEPDIRIVIDKIWREDHKISEEDALAEGGYTPDQYEKEFKKIYPEWDGKERWVFVFHVIKLGGG